MAELNKRLNRLTVKLVYYGSILSGKITNLSRLHDLLTQKCIGDMMMLKTEGGRMLFFDLFLPRFTLPSELLVKFKIFIVPGQVMHHDAYKTAQSRADGIAFMRDDGAQT